VVDADEVGDLPPGVLVGVGGLFGQLVRPAVHRGVGGLQEGALGVEDLPRALRGGAGVQVDQPLALPHGAVQDREVRPDAYDVQRSSGGGHCSDASSRYVFTSRCLLQVQRQAMPAASCLPMYFT
jgi:hypothetical protein